MGWVYIRSGIEAAGDIWVGSIFVVVLKLQGIYGFGSISDLVLKLQGIYGLGLYPFWY